MAHDESKKILPQEERDRIRSEELFREEVRRQLAREAPASFWRRAWESRNSAFTLWLLSSILLSGITAGYSKYQVHQSKIRANVSSLQTIANTMSRNVEALAGAVDRFHVLDEGYTQARIDITKLAYIVAQIRLIPPAKTIRGAYEHFMEQDPAFYAIDNFEIWLNRAKGSDLNEKRAWFEKVAKLFEDNEHPRTAANLRRQAKRSIEELTYIFVAIEIRKQGETHDSWLADFKTVLNEANVFYKSLHESGSHLAINDPSVRLGPVSPELWAKLIAEASRYAEVLEIQGETDFGAVREIHSFQNEVRLSKLRPYAEKERVEDSTSTLKPEVLQVLVPVLQRVAYESARQYAAETYSLSDAYRRLRDLYGRLIQLIDTHVRCDGLLRDRSRKLVDSISDSPGDELDLVLREYQVEMERFNAEASAAAKAQNLSGLISTESIGASAELELLLRRLGDRK